MSYIHFQWVYMTVKRTEKNPSFPWCIQQPKVLLSMQWHQLSDLQHLAWWLSVNRLYFPQTVSKHDSFQQHKDGSGMIVMQKKKKKKYYALSLPYSVYACLGFPLFFWSCHLWLNKNILSSQWIINSITKQTNQQTREKNLLIDFTGIF